MSQARPLASGPLGSGPLRLVGFWVLAVSVVALLGSLGYMLVEGWDFFDSLYMTVSILATVGLKEVHPMDRGGEVWTMVLSLASVAIIFGTVGLAAEGDGFSSRFEWGMPLFSTRHTRRNDGLFYLSARGEF